MRFVSLPKAELHCHLDGSLPPVLLQRRCEEAGVELPKEEADFLRKIQAARDCQSLAEYLKAFDLPLASLVTEDAFFQAAKETARDAAAEGIRYLELRFAPLLSVRDDFPAEAIIEAAAAGLADAKKETGIEGGLLLCGMRHFTEKQNLTTLELADRYLGKGVCGLDIAGDEAAFPNERFMPYFKEALKRNLPLTIHAGECGRRENIALAARAGARRIGHGIAMKEDPALMDELARRQIGVELCPSSNIQTKAVSSWEEYPFRTFFDKGVLVSVNTDNRTVTNTTVTQELEILYQHCGMRETEAGTLMEYAMETAFAEPSVKEKILQEIRSWRDEIE